MVEYSAEQIEAYELVEKIRMLYDTFRLQEKAHKRAFDENPDIDIGPRRALLASAVAYNHVKKMIEKSFLFHRPKNLVDSVREFHAAVKGFERANKKLLLDYVRTGIGDSGSYSAYSKIRKRIEEKLEKYLRQEDLEGEK